ncbi:hypothetical protein E5672_13690 [Alteromonas portus]|uniref:Uncharacterized protein n=1 Tax=Alteromonas portus TaxID=2565549 RepID=A0A4U0Z8W9_9ALTE|nr:hypothetical protein [Alteromonas portus]TKB02159.1 hypothetical protein E5672_13690 [Alteromonas portus]
MKTISVIIDSKLIQPFFMVVGLLFWISAWYIFHSTNTTTEFLFSLNDIQIESLASKNIDPNQLVLSGETLRDIATQFSNQSNFGVIGMVIAGCFFLLLTLGLSIFNVSVNNKGHTNKQMLHNKPL